MNVEDFEQLTLMEDLIINGLRVVGVLDASTRMFTLEREHDAYHLRPLRPPPDVVWVYQTNPTQCVYGQLDAYRSRTVRASGKIGNVNTALDAADKHLKEDRLKPTINWQENVQITNRQCYTTHQKLLMKATQYWPQTVDIECGEYDRWTTTAGNVRS